MKKQKGFTLIELLVVIAIIGILAAVLMVNLAGTRNKAKDSAIKLEMGQIRTAVESFALSQPTYTYAGACAVTTTDCDTLKVDIAKQGGAIKTPPTSFNTTDWCVYVTLNAGAGDWCVDATGYAGVPTAGKCVTADMKCK